jgi:hypothetical protein
MDHPYVLRPIICQFAFVLRQPIKYFSKEILNKFLKLNILINHFNFTITQSLYFLNNSSHSGRISPLRNFSEYHLLKHVSYSFLSSLHCEPMLCDIIKKISIDDLEKGFVRGKKIDFFFVTI